MPFCECSHFWPGVVFIAPCASFQVISLFSVKSAIIHFLKVGYLKFKMHFNEQRSRAMIVRSAPQPSRPSITQDHPVHPFRSQEPSRNRGNQHH